MNRVALVIMVLLSALGCRAGDSPELTELRTNLDVLGRRLELELPVGTRVVHVETESGMDDAIFAKLHIPAAEAEGFIRSLHMTSSRALSAGVFGPDRGAWDPHRAKALRVSSALSLTNRGLVVGLDDSSFDLLVVYALNHGI